MATNSEIIATVKQVIADTPGPWPLHEPYFGGREKEYVLDCIETGWVSSVGSYVNRFEKDLAQICGVKHAIVTVNGTAALHFGLRLAGVEPEDEVLVPSLTFVATANAISYCGATPHFVDASKTTVGIDPEKLSAYLAEIAGPAAGTGVLNRETGKRIAAILPVHVFGHPVDMDPLLEVAGKYNIPVVEDAAEALGSLYKGRQAGSLGMLAALSFNGNKIVTTGGGGAVLTDDPALAERARHITTTAKKPHKWAFEHDEAGYNYRMPNINAALGCAQLEQLDGFVARKRRLAETYAEAFAGVEGVTFFSEAPFARSNYWLNVMLLSEASMEERDGLLNDLHEAGILSRPAWNLMHSLQMYKDCPRMDLQVSEELERQIICLPSSAKLGKDI